MLGVVFSQSILHAIRVSPAFREICEFFHLSAGATMRHRSTGALQLITVSPACRGWNDFVAIVEHPAPRRLVEAIEPLVQGLIDGQVAMKVEKAMNAR